MNNSMIIILGSALVKEACIDEALALSQQHVNHSRTEPGCILHGVHRDHENPQRLVFIEKWTDREVLAQHFKEPTSLAFVEALKPLLVEPPELNIFTATQVKQ